VLLVCIVLAIITIRVREAEGTVHFVIEISPTGKP